MVKLKIARYRFFFRVTEPLCLPDYAGSTLRGVFGHALMQLSGIEKNDIKHKTPLFVRSPYAQVFEPQQTIGEGLLNSLSDAPVPYVIEAPVVPARIYQPGEVLTFDMVLMGVALSHLPMIILAWRRALLHGIGRQNRGKAELTQVLYVAELPQIIYSLERPIVVAHDQWLKFPCFSTSESLHLIFNTPLRLQHSGSLLNVSELTAGVFLRNLIRRFSICVQLQNPQQALSLDVAQLNQLADTVQGIARMRLQHWKRYSSRQKRVMNLNGLVGHWLLHDVPVELLPYVWLGQYLHVGKNTSFGLGGYVISSEPWLKKISCD